MGPRDSERNRTIIRTCRRPMMSIDVDSAAHLRSTAGSRRGYLPDTGDKALRLLHVACVLVAELREHLGLLARGAHPSHHRSEHDRDHRDDRCSELERPCEGHEEFTETDRMADVAIEPVAHQRGRAAGGGG